MSASHIALVLVGLALGVLIVLGLQASRRRTLSTRVGSFDCELVRVSPRGLSLTAAGTCQYGATSLYWWRDRSLSPRPEEIWERSEIVVVERTMLGGDRATGQVAVQCRTSSVAFELVMSRDAYAGLRSWIEAAPPAVNQLV